MKLVLIMLLTSLVLLAQVGLASQKPDTLLFVMPREELANQETLPPLLRAEFDSNGFGKRGFVIWDNITPELLKASRAVIFVGLWQKPELQQQDRAIIKLLQQYVEAGGGVVLTQNATQMPIHELTLPNALMKAFGSRILLEKVVSDPELTRQIGEWDMDRYTFTDQVKAPLNENVRGVCYSSYVVPMVQYGVLPLEPNEDWQVVLDAGPKSSSVPAKVGLEVFDAAMRPNGFVGNVPLAGVRDYGSGRVAYLGLAALGIFARPTTANEQSASDYETIMTRGWENCPSDLMRFLMNMTNWCSAKSESLQIADTSGWVLPNKEEKLSTAWKLHRGIIGARTSYSTGSSGPEEYVKKAKQAGLDFIVFLEDFAELKPGGFEQLKQECAALTSRDFAALPGFTYINTDGNHEFIFSESLKLPSADLLDPTGKRFRVWCDIENGQAGYTGLIYNYGLQAFNNTSGWYNFSKNPYPSYDARNVDSIAVVTQENGETVDREMTGYKIDNRNGQSLYPFALTLMKNAKEIDLVKQGKYYVNIIGANGLDQLVRGLCSYDGRAAMHLYPVVPPFGQTSISQGPVIELVMPRADVDVEGDIYNKKLQQWDLTLKVTSDIGLREVLVIDGDTVIRRFLPGSKKVFDFKTSIAKEKQKYIWVRAVDTEGKEAISRAINCNSWILREHQCADRNNQLLDSRQLRPDGSPFFVGYGGDTAIPDKGPWNGRIRPVGCFVFDSVLGVQAGVFDGSPEKHPQCALNPFLVYDGKMPKSIGWVRQLVAETEGGPHVRANRVVSSSDVVIGERILDGVFPVDAEPVIHVWDTVYPVTQSKYLKTTARTTLYLIKPDGISAYLWEQDFELLKDVPVKKDQPFYIGVGTINGWLGAKDIVLSTGKTFALQGPIAATGLKVYKFNKGDYVGLLNSQFGSLAVYSLTDGLVLEGDGINFQVGIGTDSSVVKAGTKSNVKLLLVGMHRLVSDPADLAQKLIEDYGIVGRPAYTVHPTNGKVVDQLYRLDLSTGSDGCFTGKLEGLEKLPGNLGCRVSGLKDNWTAFYSVQKDKPLTRIIAVEKGNGYCVLTASDSGKQVFIGHPVTADNPLTVLNITLSEDWKNWVLEVHNPTQKLIKTRVRSPSRFDGFKFDQTLNIEPGSSVFKVLGPAL